MHGDKFWRAKVTSKPIMITCVAIGLGATVIAGVGVISGEVREIAVAEINIVLECMKSEVVAADRATHTAGSV